MAETFDSSNPIDIPIYELVLPETCLNNTKLLLESPSSPIVTLPAPLIALESSPTRKKSNKL
jgi:hypothetical protein